MSAGVAFGIEPSGKRAPVWTTSEWFNHDGLLKLADLRGKVAVLHAFQMLCPACVHHGLPQAQRLAARFSPEHVAGVGVHTVFEHHAAMMPVSLAAFLLEYRVAFPVGVDAPSSNAHDPVPQMMRAYGMQGTPSLVLIDRNGFLRRQGFGAEDDLAVGAALAWLVAEAC